MQQSRRLLKHRTALGHVLRTTFEIFVRRFKMSKLFPMYLLQVGVSVLLGFLTIFKHFLLFQLDFISEVSES